MPPSTTCSPLPTSHERQNPPALPRRSHDRMARAGGDANLTDGAHRRPFAVRQQRDKPSAWGLGADRHGKCRISHYTEGSRPGAYSHPAHNASLHS
jgi:hypothetical protein